MEEPAIGYPEKEAAAIEEFTKDTTIIGDQYKRYLELIYPGYGIEYSQISNYLEPNSSLLLESMRFFRISRCTVENSDNLFETVNAKIEKLFTALHAINVPVAYGVISRGGVTNLVLGVYSRNDTEPVKKVVRGLLSGIDLEDFGTGFSDAAEKPQSYGIISGVPTLKLDEKKQTFSLSSVMKTLNGEDYMILFLAKPVATEYVDQQLGELIDIKDKAFAVSKRNLTRNKNQTDTSSHTDSRSETETHTDTAGFSVGVMIKPVMLAASYSHSYGRSKTTGISDTISNAISSGESIGAEIQNGFAIELMKYADKSIERLKCGLNNGIWQTAVCYSATSELSRNIIKACLNGELSKPDPDKLPMVSFEPSPDKTQALCIPKFLNEDPNNNNPLCSYINSSELGLLCTPPAESVPDFELRVEKQFPMLKSNIGNRESIGMICDGKRRLDNMTFGLSDEELNKHTFVCGITGSGKTTTVKRILLNTDKPFMVVEPAKKEYRSIPLNDDKTPVIFTLGKPEINCPQINPFYIMPGISPQTHIDFLKDLFIASFSFYGPMPYILEKCLHNVYKNKGWNLTLGYHPLLNKTSTVDLFDKGYISKQYEKESHKYLFPTMQELKDEITHYINEEMDYDGEVAGNIKTAIKIRLENLCVGTKGYMFNTYEHIDMHDLLSRNTVFELEGLADDSDKAFCMGLLIVLINEYRQVAKESSGCQNVGLSHLLVIEEAHRLLKNVDTERTSENIGNPKGKAVEHFTNMLAEMRSYGQGVIVAEQIPSKLALDVIKNSSNKIIHRLVSADDQQIIANTIGVSEKDAIQLGTLEKGYGLCHKEGMSLPVFVNINNVDNDFVDDGLLYNKNPGERLYGIDYCIAGEILSDGDDAKTIAVRLLNTLFIEDSALASQASNLAAEQLNRILNRAGFVSVSRQPRKLVCDFLTATLLNFIVRGIYVVKALPDNGFMKTLRKFVSTGDVTAVDQLKTTFGKLYNRNVAEYGKKLVAEQVKRRIGQSDDISRAIQAQFITVSDNTISEIISQITSTQEVDTVWKT